MDTSLRIRTTVLPSRRIEVSDPALSVGVDVNVIGVSGDVATGSAPRQSTLDIIESLRGHRMFTSADEVDAHLRAERDSWER